MTRNNRIKITALCLLPLITSCTCRETPEATCLCNPENPSRPPSADIPTIPMTTARHGSAPRAFPEPSRENATDDAKSQKWTFSKNATDNAVPPQKTGGKITRTPKSNQTSPSQTAHAPRIATEHIQNPDCIDINTADLETLTTLPGIGKSKGKAIIDARSRRPFSRIQSITRVKGISKKSLKRLEPKICPIHDK